MKRAELWAALGGVLALCGAPANASEATEKLGQCLVANASPKDQAALMRWMFAGLSANPILSELGKVTPEQRAIYNKDLAVTFERLALSDCRREMVAATKADGQDAIKAAFGKMGERAATQLMSDPAASKELERFAEYLDDEKWGAFAKEAGLK